MFHKSNSSGYKQMLEGIKIKTLVFGEKTLLTEFRLEKDDRDESTTSTINQLRFTEIFLSKVQPERTWNRTGLGRT